MTKKERRRFTREFKLAALALLEQAEHVNELADALGVRREMLYKWRAKYAAGGSSALTTSGRPRPVVMPVAEAGGVGASADESERGLRRVA